MAKRKNQQGAASKALAKVGDTEFAVLKAGSAGEVQALIRENIGAGGLAPTDLERIVIPAGGGTAWNIKTLEGDVNVDHFDAVILYWKDVRLYWASEFTGAGSPPDCLSNDGLTGRGNPGGVCARCPNAQFGSAANGVGQACKQCRQLFVLLPDDRLPRLLSVPPTSLKPVRQYFLRLASAGRPYHSVVTRFGLEVAQSSGGFRYSRIVPSVAATLPPEQAEFFAKMSRALAPALARVEASEDDYAVASEGETPPAQDADAPGGEAEPEPPF